MEIIGKYTVTLLT